MIPRSFLPAILLLVLLVHPSPGQNVSVDEGTLRIYQDGEIVGKETFSIRRIGRGAQQRLILRGTVELDRPDGNVTLAPAMDVHGANLAVSDYQVKVTGAESADVFVSVSGNRFLARTLSSDGEQLREFRAGDGSVLLDEGVIHHHYLLTPLLEGDLPVSITVLIPRAGRQSRMTLSFVGEEEIRLGGALIPGARRYHLEGNGASRDVWFDGQGRILRLEIPARDYLAEREDLT